MRTVTRLALIVLGTAACAGPQTRPVVDADPAERAALLGAVTSLEGRWRNVSADEPVPDTVFAVTSAGSAVREVMMAGSEHEMMNVYTLDGNGLVLTHYCAGGNQPRMRARALDGDRLVFHFEGVRDLKAADEPYMGEMTLVRLGADRIEERWRAFRGDALDHEMTIALERVR